MGRERQKESIEEETKKEIIGGKDEESDREKREKRKGRKIKEKEEKY